MRKPLPDLSFVGQMDWARLAAYIDGEGAILINRHSVKERIRKSMWLRVLVTNTDVRLPMWILNTFRLGAVSSQDKSHRNANWKPAYKWLASCQAAEAIVKGCVPYFVLKQEEAAIALAFQATLGGPGRPVPRDVHDMRELLRLKLHGLKRVTTQFDASPNEYREPRRTGPKPRLSHDASTNMTH